MKYVNREAEANALGLRRSKRLFKENSLWPRSWVGVTTRMGTWMREEPVPRQ